MPENPAPQIPSKPSVVLSQESGADLLAPFPEKGQPWTEDDRKRLLQFYTSHPAVMWTGTASTLLMYGSVGLIAWHFFVERFPAYRLQLWLIICGLLGTLFAVLSSWLCPKEVAVHRRRVKSSRNTHLLLVGMSVVVLLVAAWRMNLFH